MQLLVVIFETLLLFVPQKSFRLDMLEVTSSSDNPRTDQKKKKLFVCPQTCSYIFYKINLIFPSIQ